MAKPAPSILEPDGHQALYSKKKKKKVAPSHSCLNEACAFIPGPVQVAIPCTFPSPGFFFQSSVPGALGNAEKRLVVLALETWHSG